MPFTMTGFVRSLLIPIKSPGKKIPSHLKSISPACNKPPVPSLSFDGVRGLSVRSGGFDESPDQGRKPENGPLVHTRNFKVMDERILFRRYQTVWERNVRFPDGKRISFDVLGNESSNFKSVFVFPFNTLENSVTLIREYSPGVNAEQMSFVAGMFEKEKHGSLEEAARAELSEEANLKGGKLIPLTSSSTGISADKYSKNRFFYFLCLDSERDYTPRETDAEEWITVEHGFKLPEVRQMIREGQFNVPSGFLGMLALERLRDMGFD